MKTTTCKILLSLAFCFALMSARAQYVTIPDTNFVSWLNANGFAGCMMGNQMDTTCSAVVDSTSIDCSGSNIYDITGISYFDSLTWLSCQYNQLTILPTLPASLGMLFCDNNQLTFLPSLPNSLFYLRCTRNQLTFLPTLPAPLTNLICDDNQLTSLPSLPAPLFELRCTSNQLTSLPTLPASLYDLNCDYNLITSLPTLPASLNHLGCGHNQLTNLPTLPASLYYLTCNNNQLTSLPALPAVIWSLACQYNSILSLPSLPDTMSNVFIDHNPNLNCMPSILRIDVFRWDSTGINCLPNSISINYSIPPTTALPMCDIFNSNSCPIYQNIKGVIYSDVNLNCAIDSSESLNKHTKLNMYQNGSLVQETFSNSLGQYSFDASTGIYTFTVDTLGYPFVVNCPVSIIDTVTVTVANQFFYDKDFSVECKPGFDVGANSVINSSGRFRPANYTTINILAGDISNHYNLHCATGVSGTVTVIIIGPASYINATAGTLTPVVTGNTLVYSIADFGTVNFQNDFSFIVQTDTTAQIGQQVCFDVSVTPLAGDNNTANNNYSQCFTVTNSFDPNEKEVSPSGSIDTSQHELTYTIYFQNTGNDTALHVYVLDTLDNAIDESSIQLLAYSHEPLVQVMGRIVKFNFPNINLVDSTMDEPNSHGYVQYRVRLKDNLPVGTQIHNTAFIYFDFNAPVVTNTTFNQIDLITGLTPSPSPSESGIVSDIYPNPVVSGGELKIVFSSSEIKQALLSVFDMSGRKVFLQTIYSSVQTQPIHLPLLAPGIYQCVMDYSTGSGRYKLVVGDKH